MLETSNGRGRRYTELRKDDLVRKKKNAPPVPLPRKQRGALNKTRLPS